MATQSSRAILPLDHTLSKLQKLRGIDNNMLRTAGFDDLLGELEIAAAALCDINTQLMNLDLGLDLLLTLLDKCEEIPVSSAALSYLMRPLYQQYNATAMTLNEHLF